MQRVIRVLLLGAVAFGVMMALTAAPSSGGARGQATGYGDDTVPQCVSGQEASEGCLQSLETEVAQAAGSATDGSGNTFGYILFGIGALVLIGGVLFFLSRADFFARFRRS